MAHNYAPPIELSPAWPRPGSTASVLLKPQGIGPECTPSTWQHAVTPIQFTFNLEQVLLGTWEGVVQPYCNVNHLEASGSGQELTLRLQGLLALDRLAPGHSEPYTLELHCQADASRVRLRGSLSPLPVPLLGWGPCLYSLEFSRENHPPFEMARKSFLFLQGAGFTWLADAERSRNEWHSTPPVDQGGPWIQLYTTAPFAGHPQVVGMNGGKKAIASAPVVGWVADHGAYLIALAARNAFQAGIRWGPCLHSNPAGEELDMVIYVIPADLGLLRRMVLEDFPELSTRDLVMPQRALWPLNRGLTLNRCEGDDLARWQAGDSTWGAYTSDWLWINGNAERVTSAEGVTEGQGAGLWQVPAGSRGTLALDLPVPVLPAATWLSHVGLDVSNRGEGEAQVKIGLADGVGPLAREVYALHPHANQRLLLALDRALHGDSLRLTLSSENPRNAVLLVVDNLRGFATAGGDAE